MLPAWLLSALLGISGAVASGVPPPVPIVGGEPVQPGEFGAVVGVINAESLCTGIVVSSRVVVTAAHCLVDVAEGDVPRVLYGEELQQYQPVDSVAFGTHPEFCRDCAEDIYDYAYVEIETDFVPPGGFVSPIVDQTEWDETMVRGREVTVVGFGADPAGGGVGDGTGIKRRVDVAIERFSDLGLEFYAGGNNHDSCQGDSGGPAFARIADGTMRFAGVTSRGSEPCGRGGYYGAPFPALCWLRDETGVDLLEGTCCDCLDMSPPPEDEGCSIAGGDSRSVLVLVIVLVAARRRRCAALGATSAADRAGVLVP